MHQHVFVLHLKLALALSPFCQLVRLLLLAVWDMQGSSDTDPPRRGADEVYDAAIASALAASLCEPAGFERTETANHMLASFGAVTQSEGEPFKLCIERLLGDGFCFFRGVAAQMNLPDLDSRGVQRLAACAFGEIAQQEDRHMIDICAEDPE